MAEVKELFRIAPYSIETVPYNTDELPRYLSNELVKIASPLNIMANDWRPDYQVLLIDPASPTTWGTSAPLTNYATTYETDVTYNTNLVVDPLAGTITLDAPATNDYLLEIKGDINAERLTGANNTTAYLYLDDGTTEHLLNTAYASNQTAFISLSGDLLLVVQGGAVMSLNVAYDGGATVDIVNGNFTVRMLGAVT